MNRLLVLLAFVVSTQVAALQTAPLPLEQCVSQAPFGFPEVKKKTTSKICRSAYVLEHDNKAKIPMWVSYVLKPENAVGCLERSNAFATDRSLPATGRSSQRDYAKSGYDTGHIANSSDMRFNKQAEVESFILSNMTPQLPEFNRGIWKKLEDTTRGWALSRQHPILIIAGPIYNQKQDRTIGKSFVTVPHAFYKIVVDTVTNEAQVFLFAHAGSTANLDSFITSLAEVQKQSGIVFRLPNETKFTQLWEVDVKNATKAKGAACAIN